MGKNRSIHGLNLWGLKMLKIMKLAAFLMLISFIGVFASETYSQTAKLSLKVEKISLEGFLIKIQEQSEFRFFYTGKIDVEKEVSGDFKNKKITEILDNIKEEAGIQYEVMGHQIVLSPINSEKTIRSIQQQRSVSGTVTGEEGQPLPAVTVIVKGTTNGTVTNVDGSYIISSVPENATLRFSFIGMSTQEILVGAQSTIDVQLVLNAEQLDEIVVIGYGTVKKSDLTGSVSSVKSEEINAYPGSNMMESLVGRAAGVQVIRSTGAPGAAMSVRIRGTNSILGSNEPLYVVDGSPLSGQPSNISNSDIQSIEILKDASATAIYGSRGANGVVLITTKKGMNGKTQVDFHTGYSVQTITKKMDLMNASEYAQLYNEQAANDNDAPYFTPAEITAFGEGTDWQDLIFQKNAPLLNTSFMVNGGDERTQFSVGASVFLQDGIIKGSDYDRFSFRTRFNHDISDKFNFDVSLNTSRIKSERKDSGGGGRGDAMINSVITSPPTAPPYNEDGSIFDYLTLHPFISPDQRNPLFDVEEVSQTDRSNVLLGNAALNYKPIPSITIKVLGGIENRDDRSDRYQTLDFRNSSGYALVTTGQNTSLLSENTISYNESFAGKHNISAVAGFTYQNFLQTDLSATGTGFLSNVFESYNLGAAAVPGIPTSGKTESTLLSYLGRVNYSFNNKYLLTTSFRADGSSRFSAGNKWAYFPSAALAWRVSEENFLKDNAYISDMKVRTSWGLTGSQAIAPYSTLNQLQARYTTFGFDDLFTTFAPGNRLPADLKWETTEQIDFGVEIGILENRLSITADYYIKNTRDLLNMVGLPSSAGYTTTIQNVGVVQNRGFELGIGGYLFSGSNFSWDIYANAAFNRNEVKELAGGEDILTNFVGILVLSDNVGILREGRPIGQFYGFREDGYDEEGHIKYKDLNEDGEITANDKTYIGDSNPDVEFGFNSSMSFKNFQFTFFLQGTRGNEIFNVNAASNLDYGRGLNAPKEVLTDHWTPSNTNAKYPIPTLFGPLEASDRFVEDGSFLRLKTIELAYSIPVKKLAMNGFRQLQVYASGQNLLTSTAYSYWDPEVNSMGTGLSRGVDHYSYPNTKSFTVGIRAGF
jgi:TonB-linked SusC/RagA family outer membrane protein